MRTREATAVAAGLCALAALQLAATDASYLLHKFFWLDELGTLALVSDPSPLHALEALRANVDSNPPGLHLLLAGYLRMVGSTSEFALRSFALVSVIVALVGIYGILRTTYGVLVSVVGVLAVWSHRLILDHAFEVRYYGPWLAAAVWFCFLLGRAGSKGLRLPGLVLLAISAFFLCSIHYFGIITLAIIVAAIWLWEEGRRPYTWATLSAIAIGPLATAASVVFLLPSQQAVMSVTTWIPDPTLPEVVDFGKVVLLPVHIGAVAILAWPSRLTNAGRAAAAAAPLSPTPSLVGLTSLGLLVPVVIAFSFLAQPVLNSRYGLVAVAALAPVAAYVARRMSTRWLVAVIAFLLASSTFELQQRAGSALLSDGNRQELIDDIRSHAKDGRVVFEAPHQLFIVWHYAPDLRDRVSLLDFENGELDGVSPFRIWTRDWSRQFAKFYGWPALVSWKELRTESSVYLVPHDQAYVSEPEPGERYPLFSMIPVRGQLHRLIRSNTN